MEFKFKTEYTISIKDINYGGHVGNDVYLALFQEARIRYLNNIGFSELNIGDNCGIILVKAEIDFKKELFYGEKIEIKAKISQIKNSSFIMDYSIEKDNNVCATGKTVLVSFNYTERKIKPVPDVFRRKVEEFEK
ncbi:MAG TPA: thioesterase family protein [Spirochaetota bacterium]|nr:thioesterase family protein [Spirochaetota bacterium]HOM38839.1 thioesterase family protein [Spirochaetota bacterium]HPQ49897.1 thioesterase family protein [Spirochaetota bacterium]